MLTEEAMTADVVTVPVDRSLDEAVGRMLDRGIGSVVVTEGGTPVGIVTETDVLRAGHRTGRTLGAIPVEGIVSRPLITVSPDATIRAAVERMNERGIKKLPVTDGVELIGILTRGDVTREYDHLIAEAIHAEERRQDWESAPGDAWGTDLWER